MAPTAAVRIGLTLFIGCLAYGQTADKSLTFEAASVKPAKMPLPDAQGRATFARNSGGPGTSDPGRIYRPNLGLMAFLTTAYNVRSYQISGPAWLDTERFDITATMRPNTTMEQYRVMLQNLLVERFKMTVHRETRELPVYSLVVAKNGPKMQKSAADPPPSPPKSPDGPIRPIPASVMMMTDRGHIVGRRQTMHDLANFLSIHVGRPVTDATALTAKYDFTLTYSTEGLDGPIGSAQTGPEAEAAPPLFAAIQAQLGLKLEPKRGPVEIIVIDHVEKMPTGN